MAGSGRKAGWTIDPNLLPASLHPSLFAAPAFPSSAQLLLQNCSFSPTADGTFSTQMSRENSSDRPKRLVDKLQYN